MTQFNQDNSEFDTRKGAFFRKRLTTSETGHGNRIIDAGISSHFSDIYDGNFNFFPIMTVDKNGNSLEVGKAPVGTDTSSVSYLLQFPSVKPPTYGSAELHSANLHLHMEDINYRNSYSLPDIEVYKFKKSLPFVGSFGDLQVRYDSGNATSKPERIVMGSAHHSSGPRINETFIGTDLDTAATFKMPSLYKGAGNSGTAPMYYSTLTEAYEIDTSDFDTYNDRDDTSGANTKSDYEDAYCVNQDGYGSVVRYEVDSRGNCIPTSQDGPKKTWGDDPEYFLGYWNWEYAVANDYTSVYRGEKIHNRAATGSSISTADAAIDVNLKEQLTSSTMTPDNTFFDDIWHTSMTNTEATELDPKGIITAISHPHFSTEGGSSSGQVGRLFSRIMTSDKTKNWSFKGDKTSCMTICLSKKIPKPLRLARKNGSTTDLNKMRIRIKFMINHMNKSHRSGFQNNVTPEAHVVGNNIIRSFTAMLSTRPPGGETLGLYINRLNSGDITSCGNGCVDNYDGDYHADSFAVTKDLYNTTSYSGIGNTANKTNFYNGISIMKFVHGAGQTESMDTSTDAVTKMTRASAADFVTNFTPKVGQYITGTGVPVDTFITAVDTSGGTGAHFCTVSNPFSSTSNAVNINFENGRLDEGNIGENQSNSTAEDGTFTMFHTGNPDGSTRWNNWDAHYQCTGDASDTGACDFVPFVHKEAGGSSVPKYLKRDGTTFTMDQDDICSVGPSRQAYKLLEDEDTGVRMDTKQWYYLDAYLNQDTPKITWVVTDMNDRVINHVTQRHSGSGLSTTSNTHADDGFPCYLTLWLNNIKVGNGINGTKDQALIRGEKVGSSLIAQGYYDSQMDSEVDVLLESINISGFEANISNNTYIPGRKTIPDMTISATREDLIPDLDSMAIGEPIPPMEVDNTTACIPSYLSWGAHTDIWTGRKNHVFLGGFKSTNADFEDPTDSDKRMKFTKTGGDTSGMMRFFTTATHANQPMGFGCVSKGSEDMDEGVNVNPFVYVGRSTANDPDGGTAPMYIDSFTQKGFFTISNPVWEADAAGDGVGGTWTKKENPMFSTKVLDWKASEPYRLKVAQPDALEAFKDDDFVIYRAGYTWASTVRRTGIKVTDISPDGYVTIEVAKNARSPKLTDSNGTLCSPYHIHELYICPQKYWLICELYNETEDNHKLPSKQYTHSAVLKDTISPSDMDTTKGLTFTETKYSDTSLSSNQWFHLTNSSNASSLLETKVDYGLGSYADEKSQAYDGESGLGYINKVIPFEGENIIDIGGLTRVEKTRLSNTDENLTLLITSSIDNQGGNTIVTTKYPDTTKHPSLTYIFRDTLPTIKDFKVHPYEPDPYYPEFEWETNDNDLWYGFLILDNEIIEHQYHKAIMHIPFNEEPSLQADKTFTGRMAFDIGKETYAYTYIRGGTFQHGEDTGTREIGSREHSQVNNNNIFTDLVDIEGLAGNCLRFTGNDWVGGLATRGPVIQFPLNHYGGVADRTGLSLVAHFTVDDLTKIDANSDDKAYILSDSLSAFGIWIDSNGKVNASVKTDDATKTCTLISAYTVPIGRDVPTNVILTVDTGLETGNCKLFVNGRLEDQTGRKTTDGSSNNWKDGQLIEAYGTLRIGSEAITGGLAKNQFNGKLEELVIYSIPIYPINPRDGKVTIYKKLQEFTDQSAIAAGRPINAKLFIKDYHNIRGTTTEEVAQSSHLTIKKAGLGLKTN